MTNWECPRCNEGNDIGLDPEGITKLAAQIPVDPALGTDAAEQERRVGICGRCEALRGGILCSWCGCFVLFRARTIKGYCPHPGGDRWREDC
ncbi:MAG: DUF6171 family protein [Spirochaetaceae bacterium]|nr:DUF6171 family protein [Spirochaetaceae bacterium]